MEEGKVGNELNARKYKGGSGEPIHFHVVYVIILSLNVNHYLSKFYVSMSRVLTNDHFHHHIVVGLVQ